MMIRVQIDGYTKISENPMILQMGRGDASFRLKRSRHMHVNS